ncbi:carbohydrate ABC transporter permease [Kineothrix sedimenti]|uniref:Carbohydrate ABC transporter permease n=1 Tax=Kineothrix sedimenti TaxID=3123317 RepID=A0ABZ3EW29_9FIRM
MSRSAINTMNIRRKKRIKGFSVAAFRYLVVIAIAVICAGPFLWLASASVKVSENIYTLNLLPKAPSFGNYEQVFSLLNIGKMLFNSLIITVGGIVLDVILGSLCAYPLAKLDFFGRKTMNTVLIATMIIPAAAGLVVNYITISKMGLNDNFWGVILPNSVTVFNIIFLKTAYEGISTDLIEASRIDGAGELTIWWKIMLPQIIPAVATVVIMDFINKWNNFLWPLIVLNVDKYPVAAGLKYLSGQFTYKFGNVAAGTVVSVIPIIIVFLFCQKYYVNTTVGAVKG